MNAPARPLVSIVMPLYNYAQYVREAVESVVAQTYPYWELIIVDDRSSDDSYAVAQACIRAHPDRAMRLYRNIENIGKPRTCNAGLKEVRGEYVFVLDADDMLAPTFLEAFVTAFAETGADIVTCNEQKFGEDTEILRCFHPTLFRYSPFWSTVWRIMYRRETAEKVGGYLDGINGMEDFEYAARLCIRGYDKVHKIDAPLYLYRKHGRSLLDVQIENQTVYKARMVMHNKEFYHAYYVRWAEGVLAGDARLIRLNAVVHRMPDFIRLLDFFEQDSRHYAQIQKQLEEKYFSTLRAGQAYTRVPVHLPDGSTVGLEFVARRKFTVGYAL